MNHLIVPIRDIHAYPIIFDDQEDVSTVSPKILKDHRDRFIAALAHEVRNPLANINLSMELLESITTGKEQQLYMAIIMRNSTRITDLINELLRYQPTEVERMEKCSAHDLLDEVLEMADDRILLRHVSVHRKYIGDDVELFCHLQKMTIALTNIIINAIDAMTLARRELTVVAKSLDAGYLIQIEDTGCGISKDNLDSIFKPYYTNKPGGLGLGLSTTAHILKANHVHVTVESTEGMGTRFILLFAEGAKA